MLVCSLGLGILWGVPESLTAIGEVRPIQVVAFGRNAEPARGRIVITDDEKWAFGSSPWPYEAGNYLFRWPVDHPDRYERFRVYWSSNGSHRSVVAKAPKPLMQTRGYLIATLSKSSVLVAADTELLPTGAFRWEVVSLQPFQPARVRTIASGSRETKPSFGALYYDSSSGSVSGDDRQFHVMHPNGQLFKPRYRVRRLEAGGPFFEVDGRSKASVQIDDSNAPASHRYWRNALFRPSRDGSGHDFWDRSRKRWVMLGLSLVGESTDRTKLVFADHNASSAKPASTFIVRLKKELR